MTARPTAGEIRRAAARLAQLGLLRAFTPNDEQRPTQYTAVTGAGEVATIERGEAAAYLRGIAHGAYASEVAARTEVNTAPGTAGLHQP